MKMNLRGEEEELTNTGLVLIGILSEKHINYTENCFYSSWKRENGWFFWIHYLTDLVGFNVCVGNSFCAPVLNEEQCVF